MKVILTIIVIAILAVGGYYIIKGGYGNSGNSSVSSNSTVTNNVDINNLSFEPSNITVKAGSEITFANQDSVEHTVTANGGEFNQIVAAGDKAVITIPNPGTYDYHCSIHTTMKGKIIVQ